MKLMKKICTKSDCYKAEKTIEVKGLMIHSVGCPQPKASVFMKNWNKPGAGACVHAILEPNGNVYQLLPWSHRGWHCGGSANKTHIGVEMTEPRTISYSDNSAWKNTGDGSNTRSHIMATYKYAVELFAYLCNQFSLNPMAEGVIISHAEGYQRGIASNHGDVEHIWNKYGLTMAQFRNDIKATMNISDAHNGGDLKPQGLKDSGEAISAISDLPYRVKVSIKDLNIRKGPGTNYKRTGYILGEVYTIVEETDGKGASKWGRLKSGAGWISLDYVTKL
jgi:hypothetical protein